MKNRKSYKVLRTLLGMTQQEVGNKMYCTKTTVHNLESGKSNYKVSLKAYEDVLYKEVAKKKPEDKIRILEVLEYLEEEA